MLAISASVGARYSRRARIALPVDFSLTVSLRAPPSHRVLLGVVAEHVVRRQVVGDLRHAGAQIVAVQDGESRRSVRPAPERFEVGVIRLDAHVEAAGADRIERDVGVPRLSTAGRGSAGRNRSTSQASRSPHPHLIGLAASGLPIVRLPVGPTPTGGGLPRPERSIAMSPNAARRREQRIGEEDDVLPLLAQLAELGDELLEVRSTLSRRLRAISCLASFGKRPRARARRAAARSAPAAVPRTEVSAPAAPRIDSVSWPSSKSFGVWMRRQDAEQILRAHHPIEQLADRHARRCDPAKSTWNASRYRTNTR